MPAERRQLTAFALLGFVMLLWAGNSIVGRAVRFDVPPFTLAFVRWFGASLILLPFALAPLKRDWSLIRKAWKPILVLGLLGVGAFNALFYSGLHYTTSSNALLLQAATPALVVLFDRLFFAVRSPGLQKIGVVFSMLGVLAIVFEGDAAKAMNLHFGLGDLLVLGAVLVWSLYTVFLRLRPAIAPASFVAVTFLIGAAAMAPLALGEWLSGESVRWGPKAWGAFAYVCVLPSIVSYFIFNSATRTVGPAKAGQAITLMPLFGAFLSASLLGEHLHGYHFAGMALILVGIVLSVLARPRQEPAGAVDGAKLEDRA